MKEGVIPPNMPASNDLDEFTLTHDGVKRLQEPEPGNEGVEEVVELANEDPLKFATDLDSV